MCVCVCESEQDDRHTHHGMYIWYVVVHYIQRRSEGYHIRVRIAARPYLVGSQIIKAASYKEFAAV